jgi:hypothetical protein
MLGKANEIKTMLVIEEVDTNFHETLNLQLTLLEESEVLNIQHSAVPNGEGEVWHQALIIYKEAE